MVNNTSHKIMGILNVTPDSFYDGGKFFSKEKAIFHAKRMVDEGADIIDVGGESTRPGAEAVSQSEEIDRVCSVIEQISKFHKEISVDTSKSEVAEEAVKAGATIINDISGLSFDGEIASVASKYSCTLVLMHIKGNPKSMQDNPVYNNIIDDIVSSLKESIKLAESYGVNNDKIIIDPGIGFGKSLEDNYKIINNIDKFKEIHNKVLIGLSRKSLIGGLYSDSSDRLPATITLNMVSILNGADIIRVHDVKEHKLALAGIEMLKRVS